MLHILEIYLKEAAYLDPFPFDDPLRLDIEEKPEIQEESSADTFNSDLNQGGLNAGYMTLDATFDFVSKWWSEHIRPAIAKWEVFEQSFQYATSRESDVFSNLLCSLEQAWPSYDDLSLVVKKSHPELYEEYETYSCMCSRLMFHNIMGETGLPEKELLHDLQFYAQFSSLNSMTKNAIESSSTPCINRLSPGFFIFELDILCSRSAE